MLCVNKKLFDNNRGNKSSKELDHTRQYCSIPLDLEAKKMGEKEVIRSVQRRHFGEEIISLGKVMQQHKKVISIH